MQTIYLNTILSLCIYGIIFKQRLGIILVCVLVICYPIVEFCYHYTYRATIIIWPHNHTYILEYSNSKEALVYIGSNSKQRSARSWSKALYFNPHKTYTIVLADAQAWSDGLSTQLLGKSPIKGIHNAGKSQLTANCKLEMHTKDLHWQCQQQLKSCTCTLKLASGLKIWLNPQSIYFSSPNTLAPTGSAQGQYGPLQLQHIHSLLVIDPIS